MMQLFHTFPHLHKYEGRDANSSDDPVDDQGASKSSMRMTDLLLRLRLLRPGVLKADAATGIHAAPRNDAVGLCEGRAPAGWTTAAVVSEGHSSRVMDSLRLTWAATSAALPWKDVVAPEPDSSLSWSVATLDIMWDRSWRSCSNEA
ncbi:unnamed protein product, partial [Ixodes persulcatus]